MGIVSSKKLKEVDDKIDNIKKMLDSSVVYKASEYDKIKSYLSNIKFEVKIDKRINDLGNYDYIVTYTLPKIVLSFDENGDFVDNQTFKAINMLNLISFEDMRKFQMIMTEEKNKKNKK